MKKLLKKMLFQWFNSYFRRWLIFNFYALPSNLFKTTPSIDVFLSLNDPYSFLLVQTLSDLQQRFNIEFKLYLTYESSEKTYDVTMWRDWAISDVNLLAKSYGLMGITQQPTIKTLVTGQQLWQLKSKSIENAAQLFKQVWHNEFTEYFGPSTPVINAHISNKKKQIRKGHYQPASLYFLGEWYTGIERLDHLEHRLVKAKLASDFSGYVYNKHHLEYRPNIVLKNKEVLTAYVSIRSPYSYIGWLQALKLSETYQLTLDVKIVLPLMMRGITVPTEKQRYILIDSLREARVQKLPVGKFSDPLGKGVIRSYTLFPYFEHVGKSVEYIDALFKAVFVQGLDLAKEDNLLQVCFELNESYELALSFAALNDWQAITDENQQTMDTLGFWGVPSFQYKQVACWGQDRLFQIEKEILKEIT